MMAFLLSVYAYTLLLIWTVISLCIFPIFLLIQHFCYGKAFGTTTRRAGMLYWRVMLRFVPILPKSAIIFEDESTDLSKSAVIVANHTSAADPVFFGALPQEFAMIATWPFKIPIYGFFMRLAEYIDASLGSTAVCERAIALLKKGVSVVIWPEGTRSRDGKLQRFKNGAFVIAFDSAKPIIPICVLGAGNFLAPGKYLIEPCRIKVVVLAPIYPNLTNEREREIIRMRQAAHEAIAKVLAANER